jgi:hypothetical protein
MSTDRLVPSERAKAMEGGERLLKQGPPVSSTQRARTVARQLRFHGRSH